VTNTDASTDNPFATRFVRPGAQSFLFPEGEAVDALVDLLRANAWWGEIVGPHGAGKSTLLATFIPHLREAGRHVVLVTLRDGQRRLPSQQIADTAKQPNTLLVVDGYEQLGTFRRWQLKRRCRRLGCGLLVTAHAPVGLPHLYQVTPSLDMVQRVVQRVVQSVVGTLPSDPSLISSTPITAADVEACFAQRAGDVRETLFDLYNLYERRRRQSS
jgi:hypothetical protein